MSDLFFFERKKNANIREYQISLKKTKKKLSAGLHIGLDTFLPTTQTQKYKQTINRRAERDTLERIQTMTTLISLFIFETGQNNREFVK